MSVIRYITPKGKILEEYSTHSDGTQGYNIFDLCVKVPESWIDDFTVFRDLHFLTEEQINGSYSIKKHYTISPLTLTFLIRYCISIKR